MITKETILNDVNKYSGYNISDPFRKLNLVLGKQIYFVLCREFTECTLSDIGKMKYGKDRFRKVGHASVLNLINKFETYRKQYKMHNDLYVKLKNHYLENNEPYFDYEFEFFEDDDFIAKRTHVRKDFNTLVSLNN